MTVYHTRPGVLLTDICGEYMLVAALKAREHCPYVCQINETAAFLWKRLETGATADQLTAELLKEYELSEETAKEETLRFLETLKEQGYLTTEECHE